MWVDIKGRETVKNMGNYEKTLSSTSDLNTDNNMCILNKLFHPILKSENKSLLVSIIMVFLYPYSFLKEK